MRWLTPSEAVHRWGQIRQHFAVPGQYGAEGDDEDLTYAATVWRCGDQQILGFQVFC